MREKTKMIRMRRSHLLKHPFPAGVGGVGGCNPGVISQFRECSMAPPGEGDVLFPVGDTGCGNVL